jgi:hypothetical protein
MLSPTHWCRICAVWDIACTASAVFETSLVQHQLCLRHHLYNINCVWDTACTASTVFETPLVQHQLCLRHRLYSINCVWDTACTVSTVFETPLVSTASIVSETPLVQHQLCLRHRLYSMNCFWDTADFKGNFHYCISKDTDAADTFSFSNHVRLEIIAPSKLILETQDAKNSRAALPLR